MDLKEMLKIASENNPEDISALLSMLWGGNPPANILNEQSKNVGIDTLSKPNTVLTTDQFNNLNPKRQALISIAASQLGAGAEDEGRRYFPGTIAFVPKTNKKIHWCGIFALWCLHQAGLASNYKWQFDGTSFLSNLKPTTTPQPGDFGYKNKLNHHNIIEKVEGDTITSIDGNSYGGKVVRNTSPKSSYAAFYSLDNFL